MSTRLKLQRAQSHLDEAAAIVDDWLDGEAFRIEPVTDLATGRTEERVILRESPPDRLALVVSDAVHNLRVALDHAVFDVASRAASAPLTEEAEKALMFPIHATRNAFTKTAPSRLQGVPQSVQQVIEEAQPFRWLEPDDSEGHRVMPLWQLNELDVIDKHRRLAITAATLQHHSLGLPEGVDPETVFFTAGGTVEHGQVLVSYVGKAEGVAHMARLDVALVEPSIPGARPVIDVLASVQATVLDIVHGIHLAGGTPDAGA